MPEGPDILLYLHQTEKKRESKNITLHAIKNNPKFVLNQTILNSAGHPSLNQLIKTLTRDLTTFCLLV